MTTACSRPPHSALSHRSDPLRCINSPLIQCLYSPLPNLTWHLNWFYQKFKHNQGPCRPTGLVPNLFQVRSCNNDIFSKEWLTHFHITCHISFQLVGYGFVAICFMRIFLFCVEIFICQFCLENISCRACDPEDRDT